MDMGTQARVQTDASVVEEYAAAMNRGDTFPPIQVFHDLDTETLILVDGFHRLEAHLRAKPNADIDAIIQDGTLSDARWSSFAVNATHGLRRSAADKRRIIAEALRHEKGVKMSDRKIAEHIGVDHKTVSAVRRELEAGGEIPHLDQRQGKNGKAYEVKNVKTEPRAEPYPESETDAVLIALPKFQNNDPKILAEILMRFFNEDYLAGVIFTIRDQFKKERNRRELRQLSR
jgi:transposase-like protein